MPSKPKSNARIRAQRGGHRAEALAALWLRLQFYRILHTRYKTPVGEIDLVAQRFGTTIFVEVKARSRRAGDAEALEAVNQPRISRAAQYFIAHHPALAETSFRFDVIFLAPGVWPRHVRGAFEAR